MFLILVMQGADCPELRLTQGGWGRLSLSPLGRSSFLSSGVGQLQPFGEAAGASLVLPARWAQPGARCSAGALGLPGNHPWPRGSRAEQGALLLAQCANGWNWGTHLSQAFGSLQGREGVCALLLSENYSGLDGWKALIKPVLVWMLF